MRATVIILMFLLGYPAPTDAQTRTENQLWQSARAAGDAVEVMLYLRAFPEGAYVEEARRLLRELMTEELNGGEAQPVLFDVPLASGAPEIVGKTIQQVTRGSPLYAPLVDIPESEWKGRTCSTCHQWTRITLCEQGRSYQSDGAALMRIRHPFGGSFKRSLKTWADGGCR